MEIATWFVMSLPPVGEWALALAAGAAYLSRNQRAPEANVRVMKRLAAVSVAALFVLALLSTILQYAVWSGDPLSRNLLPPHQSLGYFVRYAGTHFWLSPLITFTLGVAFYGFLALLKRKNARFFEEGEMELGAVAALIAGWPRVIVFLSAAFLTVVGISMVKLALRKNIYTTLGVPFLIGLIVALGCGFAILQIVGLEFLAITPGAR